MIVRNPCLRLGWVPFTRAPITVRCCEQSIVNRANDAGIFAVGSDRYRDDMDHGTYVPLYFVREAYHAAHPDASDDLPCPIVRIGLSMLSPETHRALGRIIAEAAEERSLLLL